MPKWEPVADRFLRKVLMSGGGCWKWLGSKANGYGKISIGNRPRWAHRVSWELHNGPIPEGLCVLHRCDNPECTNPEHLFLGTHADNNRDRDEKGRRVCNPVRGEAHYRAKLTGQMVAHLRHLHRDSGFRRNRLAAMFNISLTQVGRIVRGESWAQHPGVKP